MIYDYVFPHNKEGDTQCIDDGINCQTWEFVKGQWLLVGSHPSGKLQIDDPGTILDIINRALHR